MSSKYSFILFRTAIAHPYHDSDEIVVFIVSNIIVQIIENLVIDLFVAVIISVVILSSLLLQDEVNI